MRPHKLTLLLAVLVMSAAVSAQDLNWNGSAAGSKTIGELVNTAVPPQSVSPARAKQARLPAARTVYTVQLEDNLNKFTAQLGVSLETKGNRAVYVVHNKQSPNSPEDSVSVVVRGQNAPIETEAGVPQSTPNEILARYSADVEKLLSAGYQVNGGGQHIWTLKAGRTNTRLELALIMFLVDEWLYYG